MITLSRRPCQTRDFLVKSPNHASGHLGMSLSEGSIEPKRRPTMVDVAALAGVGLKTVSRVVNSEPGVSPGLEERVRDAIAQLNYQRDANASMLRRLGGKTKTI